VNHAGRERVRAAALIAPLLALLLAAFVFPLGYLLFKSVDNGEVAGDLAPLAASLGRWSGEGLPDDEAFAALAASLRAARERGSLGLLSRRLTFERPGLRQPLLQASRAAERDPALGRAALVELDPVWSDPQAWRLLKRNLARLTPVFALAAIDLKQDDARGIVQAPSDEALYREVFLRTFTISFWVTLLCLVLGYPLAYWLSTLPLARANLALLFVLVPFWTSLVVRSTAWFILLQREGPVNSLLIWSGLREVAAELIFNRFAVYLAMVHVLLPFLVLPLYSVMKGLRGDYMRAAASLGATPLQAFLRVYFPLTLPGVRAGLTIVYVLSIGFYVTPAMVGGPRDQMVAWFIAFLTNNTINFGMAAALAVLLLGFTGAIIGAVKLLVPLLARGRRMRFEAAR
jgi:putative spermidine/putrescine transport system permease protein